LEKGNTPLVSCDDGRAGAIDHGFCVNVIAGIFIHDEDVLVAGHTKDKKCTGGVSVHHAGGTMTVSINQSCVIVVFCWWRHVVINIGIIGWLLYDGCGEASRPEVGSYLIEVPLMRGYGLGRILADSRRREARPCCEMAGVNGLTPCGKGQRKEAGVIKGDPVGNGVVRQGGVKHGVDRAGDGTRGFDGWGGGFCYGIEGPEPIG
jgi:hypothetical protein